MKPKIHFLFAIGIMLLLSDSIHVANASNLLPQQNVGIYFIANQSGWNYSAQKSSGDYFVFENSQNNIHVSILKEPWFCETKQDFNKKILAIIQGLYKTQEFMEQRKQAVPYSCLGVTNFHMLKIKQRTGNQRKFIFNPLIGEKMYSFEIAEGQGGNDPSAEALNFISQISLSPRGENLANNTPATTQHVSNQQKPVIPVKTQQQQQSNDGLSSFRKVKNTQPETITPSVKPVLNEQKAEESVKPKTNNQTPSKPVFVPKPSIPVPEVKIEKGEIPNLKFSATDPCATTGNNGLPWEAEQESKIKIPDDVDVVIPAPIAGLNNLSDQTYNSSVSSAFEAMRLVYGEMSEKDAKEFQTAWAPLFDFPSQEIVDYLNKLNPIVSQFLICREAYARNFAAVNMILLDAATAIEFDEQQAWVAAMSEASMYNSSLLPLETAMKQLIKKLEVLGNPPNPIDAKCEARRRYKRMLSNEEYPFEGEWQDEKGKRFLLKVVHNYNDGKVLVYNFPISWLKSVEAKGFDINKPGIQRTDDAGLAGIPGVFDLLGVFEELEPNVWLSRIYPMEQHVFIYRTSPGGMTINQYTPTSGLRENPTMKVTRNSKVNNSYAIPPVLPVDDEPITWEEFLKIIPQDIWAGSKYKRYMNWRPNGKDDINITLQGAVEEDKAKEEVANNPTQNNLPPSANVEQELSQAQKASEEQYKKEAIAQHSEMVGIIKHNLDREMQERDEVLKSLTQSKTQKEAKEHERRLKDLNLRVIGLQSNMQAEQDLVNSYKTGQLIHTRTAFDNYAQYTFVEGIKENIKRIEATRRISDRIERQIKLLPKEQHAKARELARKILDGKTIASGDIEKAKKLVNAFGKQIEGYAGYDYAQAKEEEAYAEIKEQAAQAGIMVVGIGAVGFGSAALVEAYGANAAAAIYGPKILGAIYGGTTGLIRGGPKEGMSQSLMGWSPNGYALSQFIDGFQNAGTQEDATWSTQAWEGAKQAGFAWCTGKIFEFGIKGVTKGLLAWRGPNSRLFKPVIQTSAQKSRQLSDVLRSKQQQLDAEDIVQTFEKMEKELLTLKMDEVRNAIKIGQMEDELQQLTASMNANYTAKWHFKYKASPRTMRAFDKRVQLNYKNMEPGMVQRMDAMGYKMDRIELKQFRNAGSGGTSSMDLDLVPVQAGNRTVKPRTTFMKKDGTTVDAKEFMDDCQKAMNAEYKQLTGISAPSSDMNLVTSAHEEAFATAKLLDKNIDMSTFTDEEIKSIGDVLSVKMKGIDKNKMMTNTTKLQARCRESSKEIDNMLLRKLESNLKNVPAGSAQAKEIQSKITYWKNMGKRFKQIGMEEANPMQIIEQSKKIRRETGGRDVNGVIDDLIASFGAK